MLLLRRGKRCGFLFTLDHCGFDGISKNLQDLTNAPVMLLGAKLSWISPFASGSSGYFLGYQSSLVNVGDVCVYHLLLISLSIEGENSFS